MILQYPVFDTLFDVPYKAYLPSFESHIYTEIPAAFPIVLRGLKPEVEKELPFRYKQVRQHYDQRVENGEVTPPARFNSNLGSMGIKKWEITSSKVMINGVKFVVRIAPLYEIQYQRNVKYLTGWVNKCNCGGRDHYCLTSRNPSFSSVAQRV